MIKLLNLITEETGNPKAVIMAGGGGVGKSYLLNQLNLSTLTQFNPDKYVEDPEHPYYNKLGPASIQVGKDVAAAAKEKTSFVWDTTASNPSKVKNLLDQGYDVYMIMVYAHPMISYASNFSRNRALPAVAVFKTWRNVYQLIGQYRDMLGDNLSIFVSDRGGKYNKEIEDFNKAAEKGVAGIKDYLKVYNEKNNIEGSSFFSPVVMSKEEEDAFNQAVVDVDYDKSSRSEDKAVKQAFLKTFKNNGVGPGDDKLRDAVKKYREKKEKLEFQNDEVIENIAEMLFSAEFQELLKHSDVKEIDKKVQAFLA
tara:strand:+ start:1235 stop:2164 length:930 start_codon:yes stop_codon:yes gene_type:complete